MSEGDLNPGTGEISLYLGLNPKTGEKSPGRGVHVSRDAREDRFCTGIAPLAGPIEGVHIRLLGARLPGPVGVIGMDFARLASLLGRDLAGPERAGAAGGSVGSGIRGREVPGCLRPGWRLLLRSSCNT